MKKYLIINFYYKLKNISIILIFFFYYFYKKTILFILKIIFSIFPDISDFLHLLLRLSIK